MSFTAMKLSKYTKWKDAIDKAVKGVKSPINSSEKRGGNGADRDILTFHLAGEGLRGPKKLIFHAPCFSLWCGLS